MTTFSPLPLSPYPFTRSASRGCSRPASPALLATARSREPTPVAAATAFRLHDLAPELQLLIFSNISDLPPSSLVAATSVCEEWHDALTPHLYREVTVNKENRAAVFSGLGLDYLSASDLESRAAEADPAIITPLTRRKIAALGNVKHLIIGDTAGALAVAEAMLAYDNLFASVDTLTLTAPVFRHLVNSGLAAFGRPRSGSAFVGETLVARLRPTKVHIHYPTPRSRAPVFDPVLLARVMAVLLVEWKPRTVEYHGVASDFPPVLGTHTRIHCRPCFHAAAKDRQSCDDDDESFCAASLVRVHLRRTFGMHAHDDLLETIAEGADPTDDDDLDPDDVPDAGRGAYLEYYNLPCIAATDKEAFVDRTFANFAADIDVSARVSFYP